MDSFYRQPLIHWTMKYFYQFLRLALHSKVLFSVSKKTSECSISKKIDKKCFAFGKGNKNWGIARIGYRPTTFLLLFAAFRAHIQAAAKNYRFYADDIVIYLVYEETVTQENIDLINSTSKKMDSGWQTFIFKANQLSYFCLLLYSQSWQQCPNRVGKSCEHSAACFLLFTLLWFACCTSLEVTTDNELCMQADISTHPQHQIQDSSSSYIGYVCRNVCCSTFCVFAIA